MIPLFQGEKTLLNSPLQIPLSGQLLHLVRVISHDYVLADAHGEADHPDDREHVLVVVEEPRLSGKLYALVVLEP